MRSEPFREPVTVYVKHHDGTFRLSDLRSTREAYDALMKGNVNIANPSWQVAFDATVRALLDPKPETVEASRRALEQLANFHANLGPEGRRTLH